MKLAAGVSAIESLLSEHGFTRTFDEAGKGSGGYFATASFTKDDRQLRLWLRRESLSVTYRIGGHELDHASFMRELLGPGGASEFPAYAEDADAAFAALRHDLERFCSDFLRGNGEEFHRCWTKYRRASKLSGLQRLARTEAELDGDAS